jgi:hemerythrin superfamily protein
LDARRLLRSYCRVVTQHHTLEDRTVFPHLRRSDPELVPVLDRLAAEHETIADLLERVDGALVGSSRSRATASTD